MSDVYINSINCVILVLALALIILIYVVFIGLYCLMGGCGMLSALRRVVKWFSNQSVQLVLQSLAYTVIILTLTVSPNQQINPETVTPGTLMAIVDHAMSYRLAASVVGLIYLVHSSYSTIRWFLGARYPTLCFSPSELKTFLNRIQATEPTCSIKVRGGQYFPPSHTTLTKVFVPHLWTEFTESIDVDGARKNRIESATSISDVLEELLCKKKVFIMDIELDIAAEDVLSAQNTARFASKVLETASTKLPITSSAFFAVSIPTLSSNKEVRTHIPLKDGNIFGVNKDEIGKMFGPRMSAIVHRELDLPAFWYFMWKYKTAVMTVSALVPTLGLFFQYLLERVSERHNLDITVKYSFVPQTDPPYQLDKSTPEIDFAEPHMVTILMPSERFLVPRDSLSRIITGDIHWNQSRHLQRTTSSESSPPILTPHTSNMVTLMEQAEEFRRSRNLSSSDDKLMEGGSPPPSYTAVYAHETEGVTPPPDYSKCRTASKEILKPSKFF